MFEMTLSLGEMLQQALKLIQAVAGGDSETIPGVRKQSNWASRQQSWQHSVLQKDALQNEQ